MESHDKRQFTPEEKVAILRRHLIEKVTVPDLGDEYHLHPTVFYRWLKQFFDNGAAALSPAEHARRREEARRLAARYVDHYNRIRLHSAIGYVAPLDKL